jgi:hypothetical protein
MKERSYSAKGGPKESNRSMVGDQSHGTSLVCLGNPYLLSAGSSGARDVLPLSDRDFGRKRSRVKEFERLEGGIGGQTGEQIWVLSTGL